MPTPKKSDITSNNTGIVPPSAGGSEPTSEPKVIIEPRTEEWHVTVLAQSPMEWERFCYAQGITSLFIELNDGRLQLMSAIEDAESFKSFTDELAKHSEFKVVRIKHEVQKLQDGEVPLYYEAHAKFDGRYRNDLAGASRDLYRLGPQRWYVTRRGLPVSQTIVSTVTTFDENLQRNRQDEVETQVIMTPFSVKDVHDSLINITGTDITLDGIEAEWVLFDTNPALDNGWL